MTFYAHRGNLEGPQPKFENDPDYVQSAIDAGVGVEVDLRVISGKLFLGHDYPAHMVSPEWLEERADQLLVHAKNLPAAVYLVGTTLHWFTHSQDAYSLTSSGKLWVHHLEAFRTENSSHYIIPLITRNLIDLSDKFGEASICSDYFQNA